MNGGREAGGQVIQRKEGKKEKKKKENS